MPARMRKIIDSNFLQREELRAYLSVGNYAVLTDYAAMEAYKGDTLASIYRSMEILAQYPKQVIVLRDTQTVCGLNAVGKRLQRLMIDTSQTREFPEYCRHLEAAKRGDLLLQRQLLAHGREASAHMARMLGDAKGMATAIDGVAKLHTEAELRILRTRAGYSDTLIAKCINNILVCAASMLGSHPRVTKIPDARHLPDRFIFRVGLCFYLLGLRWISVGGARNVKPERMRNDLVDVNFSAFATYFDGLLTADDKLIELHQEALFWLNTVFFTPRIGGASASR
jgi:hypothetical protein